MNAAVIKGGCFCGVLAFEVQGPPERMVNCFCDDCRRFVGGGPAHLIGVNWRGFDLTKGNLKTFTHPGGSGHNVERMFCGDCGTPVAARPTKVANLVFVIAGALADPSNFQPQAAVWTGSAQSWHCIAQGIPTYEKGRTA